VRVSINTYDADGRLILQTTRRDGLTGARESEVSYGLSTFNGSTWSNGFDAAGNLRGYKLTVYNTATTTDLNDIAYTSQYTLWYRSGDGYQQTVQTVTNTAQKTPAPKNGSVTYAYNVNGELVQYTDSQDEAKNRMYANNAQGQAISVLGTKPPQGTTTPPTFDMALKAIGTANNKYNLRSILVANGQQVGELQGSRANFDVNYTPISQAYPQAVPSEVLVQQGDTLRGIAQRVFGDATLWYLLAQENGLSEPDAELTAGQVLRVPNQVVSLGNTANSFKPYSVSQAIGDTTPTQPSPPAPSGGGGGCGVLGMILVIIVAIVVTIYTAGLAAGASFSAAWGTGTSVMAGTDRKSVV
jgi:hypothetical protein